MEWVQPASWGVEDIRSVSIGRRHCSSTAGNHWSDFLPWIWGLEATIIINPELENQVRRKFRGFWGWLHVLSKSIGWKFARTRIADLTYLGWKLGKSRSMHCHRCTFMNWFQHEYDHLYGISLFTMRALDHKALNGNQFTSYSWYSTLATWYFRIRYLCPPWKKFQTKDIRKLTFCQGWRILFWHKGDNKFPSQSRCNEWLWHKSLENFDEMSNISRSLRGNCVQNAFEINHILVESHAAFVTESHQNLQSKLFYDSIIVESVLIPTSKRITALLSFTKSAG